MSIIMNKENHSNLKTNAFFELLRKKGVYILESIIRIEKDLIEKNGKFFTANQYTFLAFITDIRQILTLYEIILNQIKVDLELSEIGQLGLGIEKLFIHLINIIMVLLNISLNQCKNPINIDCSSINNHRSDIEKIVQQKLKDYKSKEKEMYKVREQVKYQVHQQYNLEKLKEKQQNRFFFESISKTIQNDKKNALAIEASVKKNIISQTYHILKKKQSQISKFVEDLEYVFQNQMLMYKQINFDKIVNIHNDQNLHFKQLLHKLIKILKNIKPNLKSKKNVQIQTEETRTLKQQKYNYIKLNKQLNKQKQQLTNKYTQLQQINQNLIHQIERLKHNNKNLFDKLNRKTYHQKGRKSKTSGKSHSQSGTKQKNSNEYQKKELRIQQVEEECLTQSIMSSKDNKDLHQIDDQIINQKVSRFGSLIKVRNQYKVTKQLRKNSELVASKFKLIKKNQIHQDSSQNNTVKNYNNRLSGDLPQSNLCLIDFSKNESQQKLCFKQKILSQQFEVQCFQNEVKNQSYYTLKNKTKKLTFQSVINLKIKLFNPEYLRIRKINCQKIVQIGTNFHSSIKNWRNKSQQDLLQLKNKKIDFSSTDFQAFKINVKQNKVKHICKKIIN